MVSLSSLTSSREHITTSLSISYPTQPTKVKEPLVNEDAYLEIPTGVTASPVPSYKLLWEKFKQTPEIVALFTAIVEDILSDGWRLEGSKEDRKKAELFLEKSNSKQVMSSFLYDALITGDSYLYKSKLSEQQIREAIFKTVPKYGKNLNKTVVENIFNKIKYHNPEIFKVKRFKALPASTITAHFNEHGIPLQYVQKVGSRAVEFEPDEIAHWRFMPLDGKFYGFTPMVSILREIQILSGIKDYAKFFFDKGGVPNFMFILKNENPNSPTHKAFKKALQLYSNITNKYKSMVLTGEVEVKELNRMTRDMEFRELARYLSTVLIMVWGVPSSRLSEVLFTHGTRSLETSSEGYYRKISHYQDVLEDFLNSELLTTYNVKLKFNRTYKQDEVREVQIEKIKTDIVEQRLKLGLVNNNWAWKYLEIEEKDRGDGKPIENGTGLLNQDKLNNMQLLSQSEDKLRDNQTKQSAAIKNKL